MGRPAAKAPAEPPVPFRDPTTCILSQLVKSGDEVLQSDVQVKERRWQWARPQVEGAGPSARGGHSATLVHPPKSSAKIVIFGGHYDSGSGDGGQGFIFLNDTHILDIDENTWYQPRCRGTAPEPRYGHSAALVGTRIVYFGGKGKGQNFRDLHALDTSSLTWYQGPSSGGAPSARHGHSATLQGTRLFVFGGACGARFFGDLHCLDLASMAWSSPQTQGPKPTSRYSHAALLIGESLVIHGGFCMETADIAAKDNSGQLMKACYRDDIRVLDLGRMLWSRLRTHGSPPAGRYGHTLCLSEDDALMFGGWSGTNKMSPGVEYALKEKTRGDGAAAESKEEDESNDYCMTLRTSDMQWVKNRYVGVPPTRRYGHSATAIGPHLIIFGGWDGGKPLGDVVVLRDRTVGERASDDVGFDHELDAADAAEAAAAFDHEIEGM
eukprot:TRINITY_DN74104_c0_g1_i1.p1 TRINITY_DN74104_c0_g1~~TRINITY_DN74104_c0_g1_i1.p1  ORF type:complete len:438 (-),score=81.28 TRINITY_DN74104_c0_g1_i1:73-1386(-)